MVDWERLLFFWATRRNLKKDIIYKTRIEETILTVEGLMPSSVIYGTYSAYRLKFQEAPADYDKVYIYADEDGLEQIKKRFPPAKSKIPANLIVLKADSFLKCYGQIATLAQMFVDLWNLPDWYAKDFQEALKQRILK